MLSDNFSPSEALLIKKNKELEELLIKLEQNNLKLEQNNKQSEENNKYLTDEVRLGFIKSLK